LILKDNKDFSYILQLINSSKFEEAKNRLLSLEISCNDDFLFYDLLAQIFEKLNLKQDAINYYEKSILLNSNFYQSKFNLAALYYNLKNFTKAEQLFLQIIDINNSDFKTYYNLGVLKYEKKKFLESINFLKKSISLNKNFFIAYHQLGMVYEALKDFNQAIICYQKSIALDKDGFSLSLNNLGNIYLEIKDYERALFFFNTALKRQGDKSSIYFNLGLVNFQLNRMPEALVFFEKAVELDNKNIKFSTTLLGSSHFLEHNALYYKQYSEIFRNNILRHSSSEISEFRYSKKNPLKIGILSRGLRKYPTGYFLLDLVKKLNKEKSLELYAFYDFDYEDEYTKKIKANFYSWDEVSSLTDLQLINLIRNKGINILIDMQGHTYANRLQIFTDKPAPIQVSWAAYLASTGVPEIDYIIGDSIVTPHNDQNIYAEKIYQLPNIWCPLSTSDINQVYLKQKTTNQDIVFGCFNNVKKINDNVISVWSKILLNLPRSTLYIKSDEFKNTKFREHFENKFYQFGVLKNQLILEEQSSREKLLACYNNIDIALDTFPYSGGTTNLELSFMCVPLITMSGDTFLSRCGASVNKNLNMTELISYNFDEYVEIATNLAKDPKKLNFIKLELLNNSRKSSLFDIEEFSKDFTIAMHDMWTVFLNQNSNISR
jgi:predicted O-linked N-acetylglucosamine transferase (SPINDLY family)